jgi:DNA-binding MarR family transcriptional regulator
MTKKSMDAEYRALAELRYRIRRFVQEGDGMAREAGLEPQQYLLLLAVRGLPAGSEASIRALAERLALQHHSTVELVDRMEKHGFVRRERSGTDRRQVLVLLQPRGEKLLEKVAGKRIVELRANGRILVEAIGALLEPAEQFREKDKGNGKKNKEGTKPSTGKRKRQSGPTGR